MSGSGLAFILWTVIALPIFIVFSVRESQARSRTKSAPDEVLVGNAEGQFNRATAPLTIGFVAAIFLYNGRPDSVWVPLILGISALISAVSAVKIFKGIPPTRWHRILSSRSNRFYLRLMALWTVLLVTLLFFGTDIGDAIYEGSGSPLAGTELTDFFYSKAPTYICVVAILASAYAWVSARLRG